jgi:hypothetical protein
MRTVSATISLHGDEFVSLVRVVVLLDFFSRSLRLTLRDYARGERVASNGYRGSAGSLGHPNFPN